MCIRAGRPTRALIATTFLSLASAGVATAQVTITNVAPRTGPVDGGTRITITGTNLSDGFSTTVTIGAVPATVESQSATSLTVVTPPQAAAGARDVVVTSAFGSATRPGGFTYTFSARLKEQNRTSGGSEASGGTYDPSFSADGRYLAFATTWDRNTGDPLSGTQVFVRDRTKEPGYQAGNLVRVTEGLGGAEPDGASRRPRISADGRYVAFWSEASNLVAGDTNGKRDVFVYDRDADGDGVFDEAGAVTTTRVSVSSGGTQGNGDSGIEGGLDISPDGRWVVFASAATNLVAGDTNGVADIFLHSLDTGQTTRVSVATGGAQANGASRAPGVSRDGLLVVFASDASNLVAGDVSGFRDVFVYGRLENATIRLTQLPAGVEADGTSDNPSIDDDGLAVALQTRAKNLLPDLQGSTASQVVVYSVRLGAAQGLSAQDEAPPVHAQGGLVDIADAIKRLMSGSGGGSEGQQPGDGDSASPEMCASGSCVTYATDATNLNQEADPDQNAVRDVVLQSVDEQPAPAERVSKDIDGNESIDGSRLAAADANGAVTAVESSADLVDPGEFALGGGNVFVRGTSIVVSKIAADFVFSNVGDQVAVIGSGFAAGVQVTVGTTAMQTLFDVPTSIRFVYAAGQLSPGVYDLTVTNPDGDFRRMPAAFTVFGAPTVSAVIPSTGPEAGGTQVTITGTGFVPGQTSVTVGGAAATGVAVLGQTSLTAFTPPGSAGSRTVAVTTPAGTGSLAGGFTYQAATFTLTVAGGGNGAGAVASQQGANPAIACAIAGGAASGACSGAYAANTPVTLTATPTPGSVFTGWSGACSGTGTCQVTMSAARQVTATFTTAFTLTVAGAGTGAGAVASVAGVSPAIACLITGGAASGACSGSYPAGTVVTLTANANAGSTFTGWSGACTGTGSCQVTLSQARQVTAAFTLVPTTFPLVVSGSGSGSGSVATAQGVSPAIACTIVAGTSSGTCGGDYGENSVISLTATPAAGSSFEGWSGACAGTGPCAVTMSAARQVVATFSLVPVSFSLTVAGAGNGSGTVASVVGTTPAIGCTITAGAATGACAGSYAEGSVVTLTANPAGGSTFSGWSGACAGTGVCQVTMSAARQVTATFAISTATTAALTVGGAGTGNGSVVAPAAAPAIVCAITAGTASGSCGGTYALGTVVTLTATPSSGSTFTGWSGACTGTGACQVTMAAARQVVAAFDVVPTTFALSVTGAGTGTGAVTSAAGLSPAIACGVSQGSTTGACTGAYAAATVVLLTANAADGSTFAGWSGACTGTGVCQVTMSQARNVTASFALTATTFGLSVTGAGSGEGSVATAAGTSPAIACAIAGGQGAGTCSGTYPEGAVVSLTATPAPGSTFTGWSGACTGSGTCQLTMNAARVVAASFDASTVHRRYLAEGATGLGANGFFDTRISIANPGSQPAAVTLTFLRLGAGVRTHTLTVPPRHTRKVVVSQLPEMDGQQFSTVVESDQPVIVDRLMWWDKQQAYGSHAETAVGAPASAWYFAEGATHSGFDLFYLLQNGGDTDATVRIRYLLPSGAPLEKTYQVAARSRATIWVDLEQFPEGSGNFALADTDVSAVVEVLGGPPIIAERAMYLTRPGSSITWEAGHESAGVLAPATSWFLAEGATGPFFDTFVLLANPTPTDAQVLGTYLLPDGTTLTKTYPVAANSRVNVWLDLEEFPAGSGNRALADTAVSITMESTNAVPVVVERAMWWPGDFTQWAEAHNAPGSTVTGTRWGFAEGTVTGPPFNVDTYYLVANTGDATAKVRVTLLFEDDGAEVSREFDVLPRSRFTVYPREHFPEAMGRGFGAVIESIGANPPPIVVERAMYNDSGGVFWRAGSNALGTPLP